jgi:hypothetical protein
MSTVQISDVQLTNMTMLLAIRDSIQKDEVGASCRFGLDAAQARRFAELSVHQVMAIVANVGDVSLFPPRADLIRLLALPLPVARPMATVHSFQHALA